MRIFLSYASEERDTAERIHYALTARGHDVFFDRSDLPPGTEFDHAISKAIAESDLFVFLITPESLEQGRYTLSELRIASRRWSHPSTNVLPVLVRPTPQDSIPAYLRAVSILEPHGNVGAEVADAVEQLATLRATPRRRRAAVIGAALGVALVLGGLAWMLLDRNATTAPPIASSPPRDPLLGAPLPTSFASRVRAVAGADDGYVAALTAPAELMQLTDDHQPTGSVVPLTGTPVEILEMPTQYFVVTHSPDAVIVLDRKGLKAVMTIEMARAESGDGKPRASAIRSVAASRQSVLWVLAAEADGAAVLLKHRFGWHEPGWIGGKYETAADLPLTGCHRLRTAASGVWIVGGTRCQPGGSQFRIEGAIRVDEYSAAEHPVFACATDLAELDDGRLVFVSCEGALHEARMDGPRLVPGRSLVALPIDRGPDASTREILLTAGQEIVVGSTTIDTRPDAKAARVRIMKIQQNRATEIGRVPRTSLVSLALTSRSVIAVLQNGDRTLEAVAFPRHQGS